MPLPFDRLLPRRNERRVLGGPAGSTPVLPYSWVLTNQLAIGPMPSSPAHWMQLEQAGLRIRFSCCYRAEQLTPPPEHWLSDGVSLPDHRNQEVLTADRLGEALAKAEMMLEQGPTYLHCLAGRERSSLLAVGLTARRRGIDVFSALEWVRRCHPPAMPIYDHLELLEQVLKA